MKVEDCFIWFNPFFFFFGARRGVRGAPGRGAHAQGGRQHGRLAARSAARAGPGWGFLSGAPGAPLRAPG